MEANSSQGPLPYQAFLTPKDPAIRDTALGILRSYDCTECSIVKKIVYWVTKHIRYQSDRNNFGIGDWWMLPMETLELGSGDCDCLSILTASLLLSVGIEARCVMGQTPFGYHMWVESVDEEGYWLVVETTTGKIFPWAHRSKMRYYPDIYFNDLGCSLPEGTIKSY